MIKKRKVRGGSMLQYILRVLVEAMRYELQQLFLVGVGLGTLGVNTVFLQDNENDKC